MPHPPPLPPRRPGFFTLTPGRRVFLAAAGVAALIVAGYVRDAFKTRERMEKTFNPPPPPPQPSLPPPPVDPIVALREADAALGKAERTATDPAAKAGAVEWQVTQAEVHLRALDGRELHPALVAQRARLLERAAAVRRTLAEAGR